MKVNPIGIQSYQQLNRQERQPQQVAQQKADSTESKKVQIQPQNGLLKSAISIKAPQGSYDKYLSENERRALELLFERYKDNPRFGGEASAGPETTLGRVVDVKV